MKSFLPILLMLVASCATSTAPENTTPIPVDVMAIVDSSAPPDFYVTLTPAWSGGDTLTVSANHGTIACLRVKVFADSVFPVIVGFGDDFFKARTEFFWVPSSHLRHFTLIADSTQLHYAFTRTSSC